MVGQSPQYHACHLRGAINISMSAYRSRDCGNMSGILSQGRGVGIAMTPFELSLKHDLDIERLRFDNE